MRTFSFFAVLILGGTLLVGCSATDPADPQPVPFHTLLQSNLMLAAEDSAFVVLQSEAEAEAFLSAFEGVSRFPEDVDYASETVIGVLRGMRPHSGYFVDIYAIDGDDDGATVYALETIKAGGYTILTYPAHFVVTPKLSGPVELAPVEVDAE